MCVCVSMAMETLAHTCRMLGRPRWRWLAGWKGGEQEVGQGKREAEPRWREEGRRRCSHARCNNSVMRDVDVDGNKMEDTRATSGV